ncbi:MAG: hypothetical protein RLZZ210_284 [Pseudomonadota bacterium]|jgi:hypothetical protein
MPSLNNLPSAQSNNYCNHFPDISCNKLHTLSFVKDLYSLVKKNSQYVIYICYNCGNSADNIAIMNSEVKDEYFVVANICKDCPLPKKSYAFGEKYISNDYATIVNVSSVNPINLQHQNDFIEPRILRLINRMSARVSNPSTQYDINDLIDHTLSGFSLDSGNSNQVGRIFGRQAFAGLDRILLPNITDDNYLNNIGNHSIQ